MYLALGVDENKRPTGLLKEIQFDPEKKIYIFLEQDPNTTFQVEKVFIELFYYDKSSESYKPSNLFTIRTKKDWGYCYQAIYFKQENKFKIRAFTELGELAVREVNVVK